jgi:formylglycine-generating enzyme required for sulfatase activity
VIDVFEDNQTAYTVMEYVQGETIKQLVQHKGALSEQVAMKLLLQLLDAVEELHNKDMLHRDIKPDNVLITPEGRVVLIDFGSAREFAEGKTTTQTAMLTPGYAPIEQYSNRAQRGTYTDIYALGATLYYMLTGEKPIAATDRNLEAIQPPHALNNKVSEQISSAVMLAIELKPENRFQSVAEMREALQTLQQRKQNKPKVPTEPKKQKPQEAAKAPEPGKNRKGLYAIVALALIIGAFGIYYFTITINIAKPETVMPKEPIETETEETGPTEAEIEQANRQRELERKRHEEEMERQRQEDERKKQEEEKKKREQQQNGSSAIPQLQNNMVYVAGGTFTMGCTSEQINCMDDEKPPHQVTLASFSINKFEVTQSEWKVVMESNPSHFRGCDNCPVENVSWWDVQKFILKLNQLTGNNYRLPTEAEWEFAARGGNYSKGYRYSGSNSIRDVAWYGDEFPNPRGDGNSADKTHPVGQKQPNELGLYDMSGNVNEWCSNKYYSYRMDDSSYINMVRGGSFSLSWYDQRVSSRWSVFQEYKLNHIGFRLVSD